MAARDIIRHQVFVSSPFRGLETERKLVFGTLLDMDCVPAGMELFPASDEKWDLIRQVIDLSDYYVVILAGRYGSEDETGLGFTEKEYDYAVSKGIPILGFLHGEPHTLPVGYSDVSEPARTKLAAFREKIEHRMVRYWTHPMELAGYVVTSINQAIRTFPRPGWVRADRPQSLEKDVEILQLRAKVSQLESEILQLKGKLLNRNHVLLESKEIKLRFRTEQDGDWSIHFLDVDISKAFQAFGNLLLEYSYPPDIALHITDYLINSFAVNTEQALHSNLNLESEETPRLMSIFETLGLTERQRGHSVTWHLTDLGKQQHNQLLLKHLFGSGTTDEP